MKNRAVLVAALLAAVPMLRAQDEPKAKAPAAAQPPQMPNPKQEAHDALKAFAGTWEYKLQSGAPEAAGTGGVERAELVCNGLWLKWTVDGKYAGEPFQGLWLVGYDPFQKKYRSVWVDAKESTPVEMEGSHDAKAKTWSWSGKCATGELRSTIRFPDADTMIETCVVTEAGKEPQSMEFIRKRVKAAPVEASAPKGKVELAAEHKELHKGLGEWEAVVKTVMDPAQPATEEKGAEKVHAVCNGKYTWSDFRSTMLGQPFEGHCLVGYDSAAKQYVSYWIDSFSATWAKTNGTAEADGKMIRMQGSCLCPEGKPMTMRQVMRWMDADTRLLEMDIEGADGKCKMDITYKRKAKG